MMLTPSCRVTAYYVERSVVKVATLDMISVEARQPVVVASHSDNFPRQIH